ncbi:MAG: hypothetical protein AAB530_02145 [Patescibacteria group bacterium]
MLKLIIINFLKIMILEKWQDIKGKIKDNFPVEDSGQSHLDEAGGIDIDYIVFQGPLGKIKLEYVIKPAILDKKTIYSNRIGSETKVEYVYSENEKSSKLNVFKWDNVINDWQEIDAKNYE